MTLRLDQQEQSNELHLVGPIEISDSAQLKQMLIDSLASGKDLLIELSSASELNVTALQLLLAARREAISLNIDFRVVNVVSDELSRSMNEAGFGELEELFSTKS